MSDKAVLQIHDHRGADEVYLRRCPLDLWPGLDRQKLTRTSGRRVRLLRHITELRPDIVKLDARLIQGLTGDLARQALVYAVGRPTEPLAAASDLAVRHLRPEPGGSLKPDMQESFGG